MLRSYTFKAFVAVALVALGNLGLTSPAGGSQTIMGERKPLGSGSVVSWLETEADGAPKSMGISFDDAALESLSAEGQEIVLAMPRARDSVALNAVIDWNPKGHPPAHVYDVPHFDFHLYTIDETTRMSIGATGPAADATPPPDFVPPGFKAGGSVPMMGRHYVSDAQPEFHNGTFTATPIYGYYNGHMAFFESMITLAYLRTHPSMSSVFPQPARFEQSGWYPNAYGVSYDRDAHVYRVTFSKS